MKIEASTVTKLVISEVERLDAVTVFVEDFGFRACPRKEDPDYKTGMGNITIKCYDESWTAYWGGMGPRTVGQFFAGCDADYLVNCLSRGINSTRFSGDALAKMARRSVIDRRLCRNHGEWCMSNLDKDEARELFDRCEDLAHIDSLNQSHHHADLLTDLFGDEYWHKADDATEPNPDYFYLQRIVQSVQAAFQQQAQEAAA